MREKKKEIPEGVIRRMPRYYRKLRELLEQGVDHISSGELARIMDVTASQIHQDLNHFGGFGQYGYGYDIEFLKNRIEQILGLDKTYGMVIFGAGNLGSAMAKHTPSIPLPHHVHALFDNDPAVIGTKVGPYTVLDTADFATYIAENPAEIAVLTLPETQAQQVADLAVQGGIRAIWNFSPADIQISDPKVVIENVHLSNSLMVLTYHLSTQ